MKKITFLITVVLAIVIALSAFAPVTSVLAGPQQPATPEVMISKTPLYYGDMVNFYTILDRAPKGKVPPMMHLICTYDGGTMGGAWDTIKTDNTDGTVTLSTPNYYMPSETTLPSTCTVYYKVYSHRYGFQVVASSAPFTVTIAP